MSFKPDLSTILKDASPQPERVSVFSWFAFHECQHHDTLTPDADNLVTLATFDDIDYGDHSLENPGFRVLGFNGEKAEDAQRELNGLMGDVQHYQRTPEGTYAEISLG